LKVIHDDDQQLTLRVGALGMLCHVSLCTFISAVVAISMTLFLRRYIGVFAFVFVAFPGLLVVICGCFACGNARHFTFDFDKSQGKLIVSAGKQTLAKGLNEICLVHVERDSTGGGFFGSDAPVLAVALLFTDGQRLRLEGGVSSTGHGKGPEALQAIAQKVIDFLHLPQLNLPLLSLTKAAKDEEDRFVAQQAGDGGLARWLACQGIGPRLEPPLPQYIWVEPPQGNVRFPTGQLGVATAAFVAAVAAASAHPGILHGGSPHRQAPHHQQQPQHLQHQHHLQRQQQDPSRWASHPYSNSSAPIVAAGCGTGPIVMGRPYHPPHQSDDPPPPQPQPQIQPRAIRIVVPAGVAGQAIQVQAPDGSLVTVNVPSDMSAGEAMTIQY